MRAYALALTLVLVAFTVVPAVPAVAAEAAPPNIPPGANCDYFHWHNGDLLAGELPGYHFHSCE